MRHLWPSVQLAQKMGAGLGTRPLLFKALRNPTRQIKRANQVAGLSGCLGANGPIRFTLEHLPKRWHTRAMTGELRSIIGRLCLALALCLAGIAHASAANTDHVGGGGGGGSQYAAAYQLPDGSVPVLCLTDNHNQEHQHDQLCPDCCLTKSAFAKAVLSAPAFALKPSRQVRHGGIVKRHPMPSPRTTSYSSRAPPVHRATR